jgi:hypothetical protein
MDEFARREAMVIILHEHAGIVQLRPDAVARDVNRQRERVQKKESDREIA